jgi:hypothetical protein
MFGPNDDNGFFLEGEYPVALPDADRAWQDMRKRLEDRPVRRSVYWVWVTGVMILVFGFAWLRFPGSPTAARIGGAASVRRELAHDSAMRVETGVAAEAGHSVRSGVGVEQRVAGADAVRSGRGMGAVRSGREVETVAGEPAVMHAEDVVNDAVAKAGNPVAKFGDSVTRVSDRGVSDRGAPAPQAGKGVVELQEEQHMLLLTGLEWAAQVPTANAGHYFTGTTGRDQFYRLLIPAAWMQVQSKKSLLEIAFAPSFSKLVASRAFSQATNSVVVADSLVTTHTTKSLDKLFGVAASVNYAAALGGNWWAGGGVRADWWKHAVATASTVEDKFPLNNYGPPVSSSFSTSAPLSGADWTNFTRFQLDLSAQLLYKRTGQQAGLRVSVPFTPLNKNGGPGDSFRAELFYRLALFGGKIRFSPTENK